VLAGRALRKAWAELREGRGRGVLERAMAARSALAAEGSGESESPEPARPRVPPDLASPYLVTISRATKKLRLYHDGRRVKTYRVALGNDSYPMRAGLFAIQNKFPDPEWKVPDEPWARDLAGTVVAGGDPRNQIKSRWLGVYPHVGIHGTDRVLWFGLRIEASRGCIRMRIRDVDDLYERVDVGTPVFISP
jgi:lipoprotein-anchoring transpeptidase ErfK/SrfK